MEVHTVIAEDAFPEAGFSLGPTELIYLCVLALVLGGVATLVMACVLATSPQLALQTFFPRYMKLSLIVRLSQLGVCCATVLITVGHSLHRPPESISQNGTLVELCFGYRPVDGTIVAWRSFGLLAGEVAVGVLAIVYKSSGRLFALLFLVCINVGVITLGLNHISSSEIEAGFEGKVFLRACIPLVSSSKQIIIGMVCSGLFLLAIDLVLRGRMPTPPKALSIHSGDTAAPSKSDCEKASDGTDHNLKITPSESESQVTWVSAWKTEMCALAFVWLPAVCEFTLYLSGTFSLGDLLRCLVRTVFLCLCNVVIGVVTWYWCWCKNGSPPDPSIKQKKTPQDDKLISCKT